MRVEKADPIPGEILAMMGALVLERIRPHEYNTLAPVAPIFKNVFPNIRSKTTELSFDPYPSLAGFLAQAELFWERQSEGELKSSPWIELYSDEREHCFEASAIILADRRFLVIQHLSEAFDRAHEALQSAGERLMLGERHNLRLKEEISRREEVEKALAQSEHRYRQVVENAHDIVCLTDADGYCALVNPVALQATGLSQQQVIGKRITDLIHPEFREEASRVYESQLAGEATETYNEFPLVTKEGETVWFGMSATCAIEDGQVVGLQCVARNITERKVVEEALGEREKELRSTNRLLKQLLATAATGIFTVDSGGLVTMVNDQFCAITGFTEEEALGRPCRTFFDDSCPSVCRLQDSKTDNSFFRAHCSIRTKDRGELTVLKNGASLTDDDGSIIGGIESFVDVTDLIEARQAAERANRARGVFLANVSHEIRTPINGVMGMTELALDTPLNDEQREYLRQARASANDLLDIVNDILDLSKMEAGKLTIVWEAFSVEELMSGAVKRLAVEANKRGLALDYKIEEGTPLQVEGDPSRVRQVLLNLISNSVKFTPSGRIDVSVRPERQCGSEVVLRFSVKDTGIGIAPENSQTIFCAFEQVHPSRTSGDLGGTGLGLAICAQLVQLMGGKIWVESEPGRGSAFHFTVSLGPAQSHQAPDKVARQDQRSEHSEVEPGLRILLAEDNTISRTLAAKMLQKMGHLVTTANNGVEAVEAADRSCFDLILMDIQMPEMDGIEAVKIIREKEELTGGHVPIVALTAHSMKGDKERFLAKGMDGYMAKPFEKATLREVIGKILARRGTHTDSQLNK